MASGVKVSNECISSFQELKLKKTHKYITFNLSSDMKEIVVQKTSASSNYEEFLDDLPKNECRWAVYDLEFEIGAGKRNKLCFFSWSPDDAKIKSKMTFASSREALRRALDGIAVEIQGTDPTEVAYETVLEKASRGTR